MSCLRRAPTYLPYNYVSGCSIADAEIPGPAKSLPNVPAPRHPAQGVGVGEEGLGGVGVRSFTSSFKRTTSGLKGISPTSRKPPRTFSSPREAKKAFLNTVKNSTFI